MQTVLSLEPPTTKLADPPRAPKPARTRSVDALRALTIGVMVLVNDAEGTASAPAWLKHMPRGQEGMTIADVVVPAFLFVVGMSVPLALRASLEQRVPLGIIVRRVLWRTFGLLTMGVFMVGREDNVGWSPRLWIALMYLSFIATWSVIPKAPGLLRRALLAGRVLGLAGLVFLAATYRSKAGEYLLLGPLFDPSQTIWLRHGWWDILGQIGWAYLVASLAYLSAQRLRPETRRWALAAGALVLSSFYLVAEKGLPFSIDLGPLTAAFYWLHGHVDFSRNLGIPGAMALAGCATGLLTLPGSDSAAPATRSAKLSFALGLAAVLALAAAAYYPAFGISKHASTPTWALGSCAIVAVTWVLLHLALERWPGSRVEGWLRPAAESPLLIYFLHPLVRGAFAVAPGLRTLGSYKDPGTPPAVALFGVVMMTIFVVWLTGQLVRRGLRIKV